MWEYKDEKSFIECQKIFREAEIDFKKEQALPGRFFQIEGLSYMTLNIKKNTICY